MPSLLAHSHGLCYLWIWHSSVHGDELLQVLWLLLQVWEGKCWLSQVSEQHGIGPNIFLVQVTHHGFTCSKIAVSHPYQNCIELILIVAVVGQPSLLYATDNANGFPSHATNDEESHIQCQSINLQGISDQLVMGFRVFCGNIAKPWSQKTIVLLCPDGHFILDAVNGELEIIVVQQVVGSVGL